MLRKALRGVGDGIARIHGLDKLPSTLPAREQGVGRLTESQRFELRWEAYNVTNSFRAGDFGNNVALSSPTFGQIRTALDPRILQFALKYAF